MSTYMPRTSSAISAPRTRASSSCIGPTAIPRSSSARRTSCGWIRSSTGCRWHAGSCPRTMRACWPTSVVMPSAAFAAGAERADPSRRYRRIGPADAERHNALQEVRIADAVVLGGGREFLALRNFGIGIHFEEIGRAVGRETEVDTGIAVELERAVNPFRQALDAGV